MTPYTLLRTKLGDTDDDSPNTTTPSSSEWFDVYHRLPSAGGYRTGGIRLGVEMLDGTGNDMSGSATFTVWDYDQQSQKWFKIDDYTLESKQAEAVIPVPDSTIWVQVTGLPAGTQTTNIYVKVI